MLTITPMQQAQLAVRLRRSGLQEWQDAVVPNASVNPTERVRGGGFGKAAPCHIWAAKPRGRPHYPAACLLRIATPAARPWFASCSVPGCKSGPLARRATFAAAVGDAIAHLRDQHGMQPAVKPAAPA